MAWFFRSFPFFFFGGLIALRGLACLTYGGGLSLAAAAAAALRFWFRAQAAVQFCSNTVLCGAVALGCCSLLQSRMFLSLPLTNTALLSQVAIRVHGPPPKSHQEHDKSRKVVRQ